MDTLKHRKIIVYDANGNLIEVIYRNIDKPKGRLAWGCLYKKQYRMVFIHPGQSLAPTALLDTKTVWKMTLYPTVQAPSQSVLIPTKDTRNHD